MSSLYNNIGIVFDRIAEEYYYLKRSRQKQLEKDFGVDCGTMYARLVLDEIAFDKYGESLY